MATLVVSFAGHGLGLGTLPRPEFVGFLSKHFAHLDKHFFIDKTNTWYHRGIEGKSSDIPSTVAYLRTVIAGYSRVVFIGSSAGGYAALLFGSLLAVDTVLAFKPQTILPVKLGPHDDVRPFLNKTTRYEIYGDTSEPKGYHHISHCDHLFGPENVSVHRLPALDLKRMRDSGELLKIFEGVLM